MDWVAPSRDVDATATRRRFDRLGHEAALIDRLLIVEEVVDDDVRPGSAERLEVGREPRRSAQTGREVELAARRQVAEDRKGRRPLVPFSRLARQHRHPIPKIGRCLTGHQCRHTAGEHADPDAGAVDTVTPAHRCDLPGGPLLYSTSSGDRWLLGPDRFDQQRDRHQRPKHSTPPTTAGPGRDSCPAGGPTASEVPETRPRSPATTPPGPGSPPGIFFNIFRVGAPLVGARCRPSPLGPGRATTRVAPTGHPVSWPRIPDVRASATPSSIRSRVDCKEQPGRIWNQIVKSE